MIRTLLTAQILAFAVHSSLAADFATEMMDATYKLGKGSSATCFLVHREAPDTATYLVTVGHAFDDNKDATAVLVLRKQLPDGSYERCEHSIPLRRQGKPLWARHEKHDVAVLRITEPLPVPAATLPASALADDARLKASGARICSQLFVLGYPQGLEANAAGLPVARQGIFASSPLLPSAKQPTFLANYQPAPGDSGSPVFVEGADRHPVVAGIVFEQHYYVDELKGLYQEHVIRNPLGVAIVLHPQFVRDTLEAAAKLTEPK